MTPQPDIEQALLAALPPDLRSDIVQLTTVLATSYQSLRQTPIEANSVQEALLRALAGKHIKAGGKLVDFGTGNQFGDIAIRDVVAGDSYTVNVALHIAAEGEQPSSVRETPHIFVCYSRADAATADALCHTLQITGLRVWRDLTNLHLGRMTQETIEQAIEHAAAILLLLTPNSLASEFIQMVELQAALRRARDDQDFPIIPVLDGVDFAEVEQATRHLRPRLLDYNAAKLPQHDDPQRSATLRAVAHRAVKATLLPQLKRQLKATSRTVAMYTYDAREYAQPMVACLDWTSAFPRISSSSHQRQLPSLAMWHEELLPALDQLQTLLRSVQILTIALRLDGTHISAATAFGYAFRETTRTTLWVEHAPGNQWWRTDEPQQDIVPLTVMREDVTPTGSDLTIELAAGKQPVTGAVDNWIAQTNPSIYRRMQLALPEQHVADSAHAMAIARQVLTVLDAERRERLPQAVHLFAAIPVALAPLIGWRLNKRGPIWLYEYANGTYVRMVALED